MPYNASFREGKMSPKHNDNTRHKYAKMLCYYSFSQAPSSSSSSFLLPSDATLQDLQNAWPYTGPFHFRLKEVCSEHDYVWMDLLDPNMRLAPPCTKFIEVKVVQLSSSLSSVKEELSDTDTSLDDNTDPLHVDLDSCPWPEKTHEMGGQSGRTLDHLKESMKGWTVSAVKYLRKRGSQKHTVSGPPSLEAGHVLNTLLMHFATKVTWNNEDHEDLLQRLWRVEHGQHPITDISPMWKHLGFQHEDPIGDLRGILSLDCLVYFAEVHTLVVKNMLASQRPRQSCHYPFAAVGVNITLMLLDVLDVHDGHFMEREEIYWSLFEHDLAFHELYCIAFRVFDRQWMLQSAIQTDFARILELTKDAVCVLLQTGPTSITQLVAHAQRMQL